jgi:hypothetical protein
MQLMKHLQLVMDISQAAFWVTASVIAILTYIQARRTILQPFRTVLFTKRLKAMTEIMRLFLGKDELALREAFEFEKLFAVNACALHDAYATDAFGIQVERDSRPYNWGDCPRFAGNLKGMPWKLHKCLYLNREFLAMTDLLNEVLENPILPRGLVDLLTAYRDQAWSNEGALWEILVEAAKEIAEKYPSLAALEESSSDWLKRDVRNRWMDKFNQLTPMAHRINEFIRSYFEDESLAREYGGAFFRRANMGQSHARIKPGGGH